MGFIVVFLCHKIIKYLLFYVFYFCFSVKTILFIPPKYNQLRNPMKLRVVKVKVTNSPERPCSLLTPTLILKHWRWVGPEWLWSIQAGVQVL